MSDTPQILLLRDALQFLAGSDIPAQHKSVLMEAVTQSLRMEAAAQSNRETEAATDNRQWQPDEVKITTDFLQGMVAKSWQHADEIVMRLVDKLHRSTGDIRKKAIELGYGVGVDYRLAKLHAAQ